MAGALTAGVTASAGSSLTTQLAKSVGGLLGGSIGGSEAGADADKAKSLTYFNARKAIFVQIISLTNQQSALIIKLGGQPDSGVPQALATYQAIANQATSKAPAASELKELNGAKDLLAKYQASVAHLTAQVNAKTSVGGQASTALASLTGVGGQASTALASLTGGSGTVGKIALGVAVVLAGYYGVQKMRGKE